ncbi:hypothetical protein ACHAWF_012380 [Thalassiosira exigua]
MTHRTTFTSAILLCLLALLSSSLAFVPSSSAARPQTAPLKAVPPLATSAELLGAPTTAAEASSSSLLSVATLDPTTIVSDTLGGLLGSSAILAVPIIAALGVAGLIAFFIVSYANPADED